MKVKYKCRKCGVENYFKTEDTEISITKSKNKKKKNNYLPTCKNCGTRNSVIV